MSTKHGAFDISTASKKLLTKMSFLVTRSVPRLMKSLQGSRVSNKFNQLSSFVKDEFSGMKYWEHDYAARQKTNGEEKDVEEPSRYEDMYRNSYNAYISKASSASDELTSSSSSSANLTHVDVTGRANMVDVGDKNVTLRSAKAVAFVDIGPDAYKLVAENAMKKGDVLSVAQVAGILGAKKTSDLIPLCHPLSLTKVDVRCRLSGDESNRVLIECEAR